MADQSPDSLREAAPAYDDFEAKRARAGVAAALFGGVEADEDDATEDEAPSVGRYEIRDRLGAGGMGIVYRAHDPDLDRPVAVKLLHHDTSTDDKARARMLREARSLAKLSHPNVIAVYDVGTEDGQVFVAMELVAGLDLRRWREQNPEAGWRSILDLYLAAGRGLEAAHDVALVHRDFKPENVLVGDDGRVRVLDFGLARVGQRVEGPTLEDRRAEVDESTLDEGLSPGSQVPVLAVGGVVGTQATLDLGLMPTAPPVSGKGVSLTETGTLMGTPLYMAPELYRGQPADARSDQFAYCASLYESLYRQLPFGSRDLRGHVRAVSAGDIVERPVDTAVPARIHAIVVRGLAPDPDERYRDMASLLDALERALAEPPPTELPEPIGGGRWLAIVGLVAAATLGLIGLELFGGGRDDGPSQARAEQSVPVEPGPEPSTKDAKDPIEPAPTPEPTPVETALPVVAELGETGAGEGSETDTGEPEPAHEARGPTLRDWCHLHEDRYTLLIRTRKRRSSFEHEGVCYACRVERRADRTRNFSPRDCAGYALCGEANAEACS